MIGLPDVATAAPGRAGGGEDLPDQRGAKSAGLIACARAIRGWRSWSMRSSRPSGGADAAAPSRDADEQSRVLIVDDSPFNGAVLGNALVAAGMRAVAVPDDLERALARLEPLCGRRSFAGRCHHAQPRSGRALPTDSCPTRRRRHQSATAVHRDVPTTKRWRKRAGCRSMAYHQRCRHSCAGRAAAPCCRRAAVIDGGRRCQPHARGDERCRDRGDQAADSAGGGGAPPTQTLMVLRAVRAGWPCRSGDTPKWCSRHHHPHSACSAACAGGGGVCADACCQWCPWIVLLPAGRGWRRCPPARASRRH